MKYQCQTKIKKPIHEVFHAFRDYQQMPKWEKGLTRIEHLTSSINEPKAITNLIFMFGEEEMIMKEIIETISVPTLATITYEVTGAWNRCVNMFSDLGNETLWVMESEFRFERENTTPIQEFKKQTSKAMDIFKKYIEHKK